MAGIRLGTEDLIFKIGNSDCKVYLGDTLLYQPYSPSGQTPCFEVVDALSGATGDFVDVYNTSDSKWYKKNNLNEYEEYGIMPTVDALSGVTYYVGKLVVLSTDNHEYKWNGSSWTDLGVGRTYEIVKSPEYIERTSSVYPPATGYIDLQESFTPTTKIQFKHYQVSYDSKKEVIIGYDKYNRFFATGGTNNGMFYYNGAGISFKWKTNTLYTHEIGNFYVKDLNTGTIIASGAEGNATISNLYWYHYGVDDNSNWGRLYWLKIIKDDILVKDFIPWTDNNGNYGLYEKISKQVYSPISGKLMGYGNVTDVPIYTTNPVEDYDTKVAPPDNVVYSTLAELELMECPWVGMHATVGGVPYIYTANGWEVAS